MDQVQIEEAASYCADARKTLNQVARLRVSCRPGSIQDAHAILDAVTAALGETVGAFKATAPRPSTSRVEGDNTSNALWLIAEGVRAPIFESTI